MKMKKILAMLLAVLMIVTATVAGTVAWLQAETSEVENTFTTSDIGVELEETENEYQMIPGWDIDKDPKAWITEGSEAAILFVKVEESDNFDDFMTYTIADGWISLEGVDGVYYREVEEEKMGEGNAFSILAGDKVTVSGEVTKEMMSANDFVEPTLTFTAYAHQLYKNANTKFTAAEAWENLNPTT